MKNRICKICLRTADLIKIAMIHIQRKIEAEHLPIKMILQVHDELVFEIPAAQAEKHKEWIRREMAEARKPGPTDLTWEEKNSGKYIYPIKHGGKVMNSEFEKWLKENSNKLCVEDCDCAKIGWKAALEWVLRWLEMNYPDDFDVMDITKDIKKELENLNEPT